MQVPRHTSPADNIQRPHNTKYVNLNLAPYNNETLWYSHILDTNDTFHNMSLLSKTICDIFNYEIINNPVNKYVIFSSLTSQQRHKIYLTLSSFGFKFIKYTNKDIGINIHAYCWLIPPRVSPQVRNSQHNANRRESLDNIYAATFEINADNFGNLYTTMENFILFKKINNHVTYRLTGEFGASSYTTPISPNPTIPNPTIPNPTITPALFLINSLRMPDDNNNNNNNNNNNKISTITEKKIELSDMIFDIKDHITDMTFKTIMEKIAQI